MGSPEKMVGKERRAYIVAMLQQAKKPITGKELASLTNVSRQVIVTDVALLKTADEPIIATNRGYIYLQEEKETSLYRKVIACYHRPEQTKEELEIIVDCGVTVVDVMVEHPIYGELTGSLRISSRFDLAQFMMSIQEHEVSLLSVLTDGLHLHTLEADSEEKIALACKKLAAAGILYEEK